MDKSDFSKRLYDFCKTISTTQVEFAAKLGISPQALQKYLKGERLPLPDLLNKIGLLGCDVNWLLNGSGEMIKQPLLSGKTKRIPILAEVECETPVYNQINNENLKYVDIPDISHLVNPFIAIARGDSMRPYINPGDQLLCTDEEYKIKNGCAVVVSYKTIPDTYSSNAKLMNYLPDDRIIFYSVNTKYPPTIHKKSEIYRMFKVVRIIREVR